MSQKMQLHSENEKAFLLLHFNLNYGTYSLPYTSWTHLLITESNYSYRFESFKIAIHCSQKSTMVITDKPLHVLKGHNRNHLIDKEKYLLEYIKHTQRHLQRQHWWLKHISYSASFILNAKMYVRRIYMYR